jgi:hypothetical protein
MKTRNLLSALLSAAITSSGIWYFFGGPMWLLGILAALPWVFILSSRFNLFLSSIFTGSTILVIELWVGIVSPFFQMPLFLAVGGSLLIIGFSGVLIRRRDSSEHVSVDKRLLFDFISVSAGSIVWVLALFVALFIPRSSKVGWVMLGDSANNILMARDVISAGGVEVGAQANPAPLPSALIAFSIAPSRENQFLTPNLFSDVMNLAGLWAALIALTCIAAGSLAFVAVRHFTDNPFKIRGLAILSSLLPLSWFVTGYPLDFGFFNSQLALPVLFVSLVSYYASILDKRNNLIVQPLLGTSLLAIWAPLVVIPVALFIATLVTTQRSEWRVLFRRYVLIAISALQFVLYASIVVLPMSSAMSSSVGAAGGVYGFNHSLLWALAAITPIFARLASKSWNDPRFVGPLAISLGVASAELYLLYLNRSLLDPWTYYPLKFLWIASTVLLLLLIVQVSSLMIQRFVRARTLIPAVVSGILGMVVFLNWSPMKVSGYIWKDPIQRILAGSFMGRGDSTAIRIFDSSKTEDTEFYWHSAIADESAVNFWLLQNAANSIKPQVQKLREFAYGMYSSEEPASLCLIANEIPNKLIVHSPVLNLQTQVNDFCPELGVVVTRD